MLHRRTIVLALLLATAAALPWPRVACAEDLPPRSHALLLLRVLAYDRTIRQRSGAVLTVLLLSQPGERGSEQRTSALREAFESVARDVVVDGLPVRVKELPYRGAAGLEADLEALHPALLVLDAELAPALPDLIHLTRRHGVSTAGTRAMAEAGAAIGVSARGGRATLSVNLAGARAEGASFDPALLDLCEVIRE
jgi:hypothetical protein